MIANHLCTAQLVSSRWSASLTSLWASRRQRSFSLASPLSLAMSAKLFSSRHRRHSTSTLASCDERSALASLYWPSSYMASARSSTAFATAACASAASAAAAASELPVVGFMRSALLLLLATSLRQLHDEFLSPM